MYVRTCSAVVLLSTHRNTLTSFQCKKHTPATPKINPIEATRGIIPCTKEARLTRSGVEALASQLAAQRELPGFPGNVDDHVAHFRHENGKDDQFP